MIDSPLTPDQQVRIAVVEQLLAVSDPFDVWRKTKHTQSGDPARAEDFIRRCQDVYLQGCRSGNRHAS